MLHEQAAMRSDIAPLMELQQTTMAALKGFAVDFAKQLADSTALLSEQDSKQQQQIDDLNRRLDDRNRNQ